MVVRGLVRAGPFKPTRGQVLLLGRNLARLVAPCGPWLCCWHRSHRGRILGGDERPCAPGGDRNHRRRAGRDMTPEHSPGIWAPAPARVCAFACSYKCSFMFLKGCILSARCDIFWKEFQRALCKVLNKLLNKIETESGEVKRTFKNVCVHLISPGTAIM